MVYLLVLAFSSFISLVVLIYLIITYFESNATGTGYKFKKRTVIILYVTFFLALIILILSIIAYDYLSKLESDDEWKSFVNENKCILIKINKNKKNNVWSCRNGVLEVISDYLEEDK